MGTYTTNYNLFMPSIGEQGWGDLVNGNFTTIDTAMKNLSNHIETLDTKTDAMKDKLDVIELNDGVLEGKYGGEFNGNVTGKINVTSFGNDSNNLKVCDILSANFDESTGRNAGARIIFDLPMGIATLCNTSIINIPMTVDDMLNSIGSVNATVTVADTTTNIGTYWGKYSVTVVNTKTNTTILSNSVQLGGGASTSIAYTFARELSTTYTITATCTDSFGAGGSFRFNVSVPATAMYVS